MAKELDTVNSAVEQYLSHFHEKDRQDHFLKELLKGLSVQERTRFFELTTIGLMKLINEFGERKSSHE
jgi:hypothetical protein